MFGGAPEEEVVEEEIPVSAIPAAIDASVLMSSHSFSGASSPMSTNMAPSSSFGSFAYQVDEDTSAFKYESVFSHFHFRSTHARSSCVLFL